MLPNAAFKLTPKREPTRLRSCGGMRVKTTQPSVLSQLQNSMLGSGKLPSGRLVLYSGPLLQELSDVDGSKMITFPWSL